MKASEMSTSEWKHNVKKFAIWGSLIAILFIAITGFVAAQESTCRTVDDSLEELLTFSKRNKVDIYYDVLDERTGQSIMDFFILKAGSAPFKTEGLQEVLTVKVPNGRVSVEYFFNDSIEGRDCSEAFVLWGPLEFANFIETFDPHWVKLVDGRDI